VRGRQLPSPVVGKMITLITTTVYGDEKAWGYAEVHKQSPRYRGFHRYRVISVLRDGRLAEYSEDMGLASKFKGITPIAIPSFWEHSVDELRDLADELRGRPRIDVKDLLELESYIPA